TQYLIYPFIFLSAYGLELILERKYEAKIFLRINLVTFFAFCIFLIESVFKYYAQDLFFQVKSRIVSAPLDVVFANFWAKNHDYIFNSLHLKILVVGALLVPSLLLYIYF